LSQSTPFGLGPRQPREIPAEQEALDNTLHDRVPLAYRHYPSGVDLLLNALDADRDLFAAELRLAEGHSSNRPDLNAHRARFAVVDGPSRFDLTTFDIFSLRLDNLYAHQSYCSFMARAFLQAPESDEETTFQ